MNQVTLQVPSGHAVKNTLAKIGGTLLVAYLCFVVREIWVPLGLAFILAMVLDPVVDRMETRKWSRAWASAFIFGSFLLIAGGLLFLAYPYVVSQVDTLQRGLEHYFPNPSHAGLLASFRRMRIAPSASNAAVSAVENARASFQHSSGWLAGFGMSFATNAIWVVIIPIVSFYALRDFHVILAKGLLLIPSKRRDLAQTAISEITAIFGKYLRGLAIVSVLNGVATTILLACLRVPGALVLGVMAGMLYSVPYIGALVTLVLTAAVAFVGGGPNLAMLAVGLSVVLHQVVFDQIVSPRILGGHVGLHPILSIVALLVGNLLLGIIGMVLAVPIAACIQIAVLALIPKLSREIELPGKADTSGDTVKSLEEETKAQHQKVDATSEMHAAVSAVVESIEIASDAEAESSPEPS